MGTPIFNEKAKEKLLEAIEALKEGRREVDDTMTAQAIEGIEADIEDILNWEEDIT